MASRSACSVRQPVGIRPDAERDIGRFVEDVNEFDRVTVWVTAILRDGWHPADHDGFIERLAAKAKGLDPATSKGRSDRKDFREIQTKGHVKTHAHGT